VEAKTDDETAAKLQMLSPLERNQQLMLMLQALLAERCKLQVEHATKDLPVYALVVGRNGPKLQPSAPPEDNSSERVSSVGIAGKAGPNITMTGRGSMRAIFTDMDTLANALSGSAGRPVVNKTGLTGHYDFALNWTPDEVQVSSGGPKSGLSDMPLPDASAPSLFTALQEQLGLKLEPEKAPMPIILIKHLQRPAEN
jgi:uncharacterized protein (TIGR03435 family)